MVMYYRKLPLFKGKSKLARLLFNKSIRKAKDVWVRGKYGCKYLLPNLTENVSFDIYVNGIYEQDTLEFLAKKISPGGVFLDLGANIGAITIPLSKRRSDVRIVCVEASPRIFNYLERNLEENDLTGVLKVNKALYYTDDNEVDFFSPEDKFGKGSLSPVFTSQAQRVTTIRLDTLIERLHLTKVDLIKVDVEGYEYHVFKGAETLLIADDAPDIFFEFVDWAEDLAKGISVGDAQQLLKSWGYRIYQFHHHKKEPVETNDVVFRGALMLFATKKPFKQVINIKNNS
jgi:FkbM family methyltransferase